MYKRRKNTNKIEQSNREKKNTEKVIYRKLNKREKQNEQNNKSCKLQGETKYKVVPV